MHDLTGDYVVILRRKVEYSPATYEDEEKKFALDEGVGEVDLAIIIDTTSSMGQDRRL